MDESTGFEGIAQLEVFSRASDWNVAVAEEFLQPLAMNGTTVVRLKHLCEYIWLE
jgi:hypothetical protein